MRSLTCAVLTVLGVACAGKASAPPTTASQRASEEHSGQFTGAGAGTAETDFSSWRDWMRVNGNAPFLSQGHGGKWVDVFVEPRFADAYRVQGRAASPGVRIVKAGYKDSGRVTFLALTVMAKMPPGYDQAHGDWYYAVLCQKSAAGNCSQVTTYPATAAGSRNSPCRARASAIAGRE